MKLRNLQEQGVIANALMVSFIILTSVGAAMVYPPLGLIVGGLACGIFGFLLGLE
jgi:hypothetical protein|tara:strand:- start:386 stop:550 length:165 start_codon:yes stop_codon:yes gene_type:complete